MYVYIQIPVKVRVKDCLILSCLRFIFSKVLLSGQYIHA